MILISSIILLSYIAKSQCNYSISLYDTFGDGWNGGNVSVLVNGSLVLDQITLNSGSGPLAFNFPVSNGDDISTIYTAGGWETENEYTLYDSDGIMLAQQGVGGGTPGNIIAGSIFANCSTCPAPINLDANSIYESSAILNWDESGTAVNWNLEWGLQGFALGSGNLENHLNQMEFALSGLTMSTNYQFYVQADCGSEQSNWSGPYTFTTITPPLDNPSNCNLDLQIVAGYDHCLDAYIDVNDLYGSQLGTDVLVDKMNIIIETPDVSEITFSLTSPNQVTLPISYWHGIGSNLAITNVLKEDEICGNAEGLINITVANGTNPYNYSWSNGAISQDLNNLSEGMYTVVITDANGCTIGQTYSL